MLIRKSYGPVIQFKMARSILKKPLYFTAAYLFGELLIDTGCARTSREFLWAIQHLSIQEVVITHSHEDHFGAAGNLKVERGFPVKAHPDAIVILAEPQLLKLRWFQRQFWGTPDPIEAEVLGDVLEVENRIFEVIETPGHSPDHIVLFERESGFLFSGDVVVGSLDLAIRADFDIWGILDSLKKLQTLESSIIFSGSGRVIKHPRTVLTGHIARIETQLAKVKDEFENGQSQKEIIARIHREAKKDGHNLRWVELITRKHVSTENLVRSILSSYCSKDE